MTPPLSAPSSSPWSELEAISVVGFGRIYEADAVDRARLHVEQAHQQDRDELEGIRRFLRGEQVGVSTGICDSTTYGYGTLDPNGYWQYPVPPALVALRGQLATAQQEIERLKRHAVVDDIAFDSANTALVEAETDCPLASQGSDDTP
jgi:hypothetical protein